jgi:predicted 3-demethylubiquinone-9 3-methyltransferase (glyoxalase superfamily)
MVQSCLPFLMFQGEGAAALEFYLATFPDARAEQVERYGEGEAVPAGGLKAARLVIAGQRIRLFDSPPVHDFTFTPSFSLFLECDGEEELRRLGETLAEGGKVMMPADNYGFSRLFTWVSDRFGVSWQLNQA